MRNGKLINRNIFAVYKPKGLTSHDVIQELRSLTGIKKIGHAGTLDPLARGILVIGIGREATKKLSAIVKKEKEYFATVRLGISSTTDDKEGVKQKVSVPQKPTEQEIRKTLRLFRGKINQRPPIFSAIKIKGRRAYKLARQGEKVILKPRLVEIKEISLISYQWPYVKIRVVTGPGAYIRALARDIGEELGTKGYLSSLERTRVGDFKKSDSITLKRAEKIFLRK